MSIKAIQTQVVPAATPSPRPKSQHDRKRRYPSKTTDEAGSKGKSAVVEGGLRGTAPIETGLGSPLTSAQIIELLTAKQNRASAKSLPPHVVSARYARRRA